MDTRAAAARWAEVWARGWREHDPDAVASLYAEDAVFRSQPFRRPHEGSKGVRDYAVWAFADEDAVECWFGQPIASEAQAAVEYWAVIESEGREETLAGVSVLRFDADGLVTEHRDYWAMHEGGAPPPEGWGR